MLVEGEEWGAQDDANGGTIEPAGGGVSDDRPDENTIAVGGLDQTDSDGQAGEGKGVLERGAEDILDLALASDGVLGGEEGV